MGSVVLTGKGRRWLATGHPWAFADDLASVEAEPGDLVAVEDPNHGHIGWGLYSAGSRIAIRMVTRAKEKPEREFWAGRVARAVNARERLGLLGEDGACRLIAGDADGVPGLVVDRYARVIVMQSGTQAADRLRDLVLELVEAALPWKIECAIDRSDAAVRKLEGLEKRVEVVRGALPAEIVVREDELAYEVDVLAGHKTGHYLDQRDNRKKAARLPAATSGGRVLDAFAYDGLFGIRAALAGAKAVLCMDQSQPALERAARNAQRNRVADRVRCERADCMDAIKSLARQHAAFDLVVVDPPAFAKSRREIEGAARGYIELNRRALEIVAPGGYLVSASCSYNVRAQAFVEYLARAAATARREAYLEALTGAAPDHPQLLTLPESAYLKCAFVRVAGADRMASDSDGHDQDRDRAERQEA